MLTHTVTPCFIKETGKHFCLIPMLKCMLTLCLPYAYLMLTFFSLNQHKIFCIG